MKIIENIKKFLCKIADKIVNGFDVNDDGKVNKEDLKDLQRKTKVELEQLGRKVGIELDRRLTKAKLIQQIKKNIK